MSQLSAPRITSVYEPRGAPSRDRRITPGRGVLSSNLRQAIIEAGRRRRAEAQMRSRVMPMLLEGPEFIEELDEGHNEL